MENENKDVLVSICIPTYNNANYIGKTLDSLINQTHTNIEIIVNDNASTDNTREVVLEKQQQDDRIIYNRNEENLGYVGNIKAAVAIARSEYLAIFHSDDIYDDTIIEKELALLLENDNRAAVMTNLKSFYGEDLTTLHDHPIYDRFTKLRIYNKKLNAFTGGLKEFGPIFAEFGNIFVCPTLLCRKSVYLETEGYTNEYPSNEDFDLWIKILKKGYEIGMLYEPLLKYRHTATQGSALYSKSGEMDAMYRVLEDFKQDNEELFQNKEVLKAYNIQFARGYCHTSLRNWKRGNLLGFDQLVESRKFHVFSPFSKVGFYQNVLGYILFFFVKLTSIFKAKNT